MIDYTKDYIKYPLDVISGKITACDAIVKSCKRFMSFFDRDDMWFDYDSIDKYIRFVYQMRHYQGIFKNKHFVLLPWEQWVFAGLWGFRWKSDDTVVTNRALIFCARKNAKTALCAAIALIHVWFQENGAEVDFMANSVKQAHIAMDHT